MKFEEIIPALREGCSIRHVSWPKEYSVYMKDGCLHDQQCRLFDMMNSGMINWLSTDDWEIIEEPEPDWEYIIKNKCLCWFWDSNFYWAMCGTLGKIEKGVEYEFTMFDEAGNRSAYKHCRPARRDEVTFYEDKEE